MVMHICTSQSSGRSIHWKFKRSCENLHAWRLKKHPPACEHYAHSFPMNSPLRTTSWACCSRVFFSFGFLYVKTESDNRKLQRPEPNLKQRGVWVFSTTKIDSDARLESLRLLRDEEKAISEFEAVSVPPLGRSQPVFRRGIQSTGSRFMSLRSSFGKNEKSVTGKLVEILLQSKTDDLRKKIMGGWNQTGPIVYLISLLRISVNFDYKKMRN